MIVLLDNRLGRLPSIRCIRLIENPDVHFLICRDDGKEWECLAEGDSKPLTHWLAKLAVRPPTATPVLLFWSIPENLVKLIKEVNDGLEGGRVDCGVVLPGPLRQGQSMGELFAAKKQREGRPCRFVDSVTYVGNENQNSETVSDEGREQFLGSLIQLICEGGEEIVRALGLFGDFVQPFQAVGLDSKARKIEPVKLAVRSLLLELLQKEFRKEMQQDAGTEMEGKAEASIERCKALDLAWDRAMSNVLDGWGKVVRETPNAFNGWKCPWVKERMVKKGEEAICANFRIIREIRTRLQQQVVLAAADIRRQGQEAFAEEQREKIAWIQDRPTLGRLAAMLARHFPKYDAMTGGRPTGDKQPCSSLSDPDEAACRAEFVDATTAVLQERAAKLLSIRGWLVIGGLEILLGILAWAGTRYPEVLQGPAWGLGGMAVLAIAAGVWSWAMSRKAVRALENHLAEKNSDLVRLMEDKMRWVLGKARTTLEIQVVAFNRKIARRLHRSLGLLFNRWDEVLALLTADAAIETGVKPDFSKLGLGAYLDEIQTSIAGLGPQVARYATGDGSIEVEIPRNFDSLVMLAYRRSLTVPVSQSETEDALVEMVQDRSKPPVLSQVGNTLLARGLFRAFILPQDYAPALDASLRRKQNPHVSDRYSYLRSTISGPAVWVARQNLSEDEMRESLKVLSVGAR